ncbi:hypothetical protein QQP08_024196 [Theobroma cacao]|nr:hypothetical protein QQP08_024196 [Theobroma cacao]
MWMGWGAWGFGSPLGLWSNNCYIYCFLVGTPLFGAWDQSGRTGLFGHLALRRFNLEGSTKVVWGYGLESIRIMSNVYGDAWKNQRERWGGREVPEEKVRQLLTQDKYESGISDQTVLIKASSLICKRKPENKETILRKQEQWENDW